MIDKFLKLSEKREEMIAVYEIRLNSNENSDENIGEIL